MTSRYDSLNVSLQVDRHDKQRLNKTIDASSQGDEQVSKADNDDKVNKFKELYFKNEKLRKELKLLNQKLNEKLEKLKLPSVKKKAQSVDLNHVPPSKALQRELQNAYKQIAMYKKQIEGLKSKQQTSQNYDKLRNSENMIGYMDMEINQIQEQLKSIKNVKKLQEKGQFIVNLVLSEDVDNLELRQRLNEYQTEVKNFKEKLRDIDRKSRKRQQDFKKQQAYLVALQSKLRKNHAEQREDEKPEPQKPKQASQKQFAIVRDEIKFCKFENEQLCKKLDMIKKNLRHTREQKVKLDQKLIEKQGIFKQLVIQVESYTRLLKDMQIKKYEQTGVRQENRDIVNKILKLEEIEDQPENASFMESSNHQKLQFSKLASSTPAPMPNNEEREWKGKMRKVSMGYMTPTDQSFQDSGKLIGLKVYLDENRMICGLATIMVINNYRVESKIQGTHTNMQLKWEVPMGDQIGRIIGSFTQQGYLGQMVLISRTGLNGRFGSSYKDAFQFNLEIGQNFTGIFGGLRRLGQDVRITQIGFWISKS